MYILHNEYKFYKIQLGFLRICLDHPVRICGKSLLVHAHAQILGVDLQGRDRKGHMTSRHHSFRAKLYATELEIPPDQ